MAIINLTELYDHIMPHVPGVSTPIVNHHLNDIARLFCRKTRAWNFLTDPLDLEAGVAQVDTEALISSAEPVSVLEVWYLDDWLPPLTDETYQYLSRDEQGTPTAWSGLPGAVGVLVVPTPLNAEAGAIKLRIAMRPRVGSLQFDADVYRDWYQVLAAGVKSMLFMSPKKPYTEPTLAKLNWLEFQRGMAEARWRRHEGYTPHHGTVRPPPFGV